MKEIRYLPVRLHSSEDLSVDERREADADRVHPKHRDVLLYAAVSDNVLVSQRLRQRGQTVHRDRHSHQNAHAAQRDHDAIGHDAERGGAVHRYTGELQLHPEGHKHADLLESAVRLLRGKWESHVYCCARESLGS